MMEAALQVEGLSKRFGEQLLFENISFGVGLSQKTALIAKNGKGKSTLLKIIAGEMGADSGTVIFRNGLTLGYLEQEPELNPENHVFEEVFNTDTPLLRLVKSYEEAVTANDTAQLEELLPQMDACNAWDYEHRIKQIISRLKVDTYTQPIKTLSGGQKKRVGLAKVLISNPDFLLLDEPTNHLDMEMIEWLEEYLEKSKTTLLMVTHDRYFLDRVCDHIIEMDDAGIYSYTGNYSYYLVKREERMDIRNAAIEKARNLLRTEQEWMRRMPQARSHKAKYRIDNFYKLKEVASQQSNEKQLALDIQGQRLGKKILELEHISKSYGDQCLIRDFSYKFVRGEKIGIIGKNGAGKSTLLDIITRKITPDTGTIDTGETVVYGYYTQSGINFKEDERPIDIVREIAESIDLGNGRVMAAAQFLEYFLFPDKLQYSPIAKLSGGERRRLYLMTILMSNPNFLILDEPTNDLDIVTLNILEEYLQGFKGCLLVVSHDRFFTDKVADRVFAFEENGIIKDFPGNYTQYKNAKEEEELLRKQTEKKTVATPPPAERKKESKTKLTFKERQEMEQLEKELEQLTAEREELETALSSGTLSSEKLITFSERIAEIIHLQDEKETKWLEFQLSIDH